MEATAEEMAYTADKIAVMWTWGGFDGFTASSCGKCKATANVLHGGAGWFCPCGHYVLLSWSHTMIPHDAPTYGPTWATIQDGLRLGEERNPNHWRTQYLRQSRVACTLRQTSTQRGNDE